jgi:hypothetical protein
VKTAAEAELHTVTLRHQPASAQHSLKNRETHAHRVMLAHRPVVPATAKCAGVVKTRVATGRLRVAPIASHATVPPELRLVRLVTAIRVRLVMTVLRVVSLVLVMIAQRVRLMVTALRVVSLDLTVRLVRLVTAIRVRLVMTVLRVVSLVLVMIAQRVRSMVTVLLAVTLDLTVRLAKTVAHAATSVTAHLAEILVQTAQPVRSALSVMAAAQTA